MLTASARALWPFFVRFSAPSPAWIARGGAPPASRCDPHVYVSDIADVYINYKLGAAADCLPALGSRKAFAFYFSMNEAIQYQRDTGSILAANNFAAGVLEFCDHR